VAAYTRRECATSSHTWPEPIDHLRDGEVSAFDVDRVLFQHLRAPRGLWKSPNMTDVEATAHHLPEPSIDWWWKGGATKER
jgi:hypothetical protein